MKDHVIRVLSIEDNRAEARLIHKKLNEARRVGWNLPRFEVRHVTRLGAALACLDEGRFDVVLTDLDLPDSRPDETVTTLRESFPHVPLVVLTGRDDETLAQKSVRAGVQDYLYKNEATGSLLARTMMYAIERQQTLDTLEQRIEERTRALRQANQALKSEIAARKTVEEALQKSKSLLEATGRMARVGGWELDAETLEVRWTPETYRIHQIPMDRKPDLQEAIHFFHPDDRERLTRAIQAALDDGEPYDLELRFITAQGNQLWTHTICHPQIQDGKIVKLVGTFQDITERKQMEQALRESETRLRAIGDNLSAGQIYQLRVEPDGPSRFTYVSAAVEKLHECTVEEALNDPSVLFNRVVEEDVPGWTRATEKAIREMSLFDHTMKIRRNSGEIRWHRMISKPRVAEDGAILFDGIDMDVTEQKRAEEALNRYVDRLCILHEIDTAILQAQSPEEIAGAALEGLHHLIPSRRSSIAEIDFPGQRARDLVVLVDGKVETTYPDWHPLSAAGQRLIEAFQQGRACVTPDIAALETCSPLEQALKAAGLRSSVSVPLLVQGVLIGTLNLSSEIPGRFQSDHIEILEEVAASLAVALRQARLLEQTQQDAETKALLLREVNHRVKNNLDAIIGLLYVERRHAPPGALPIYRPIVESLTQRIKGLAEAHRLLSEVEWAPLRLDVLAEQIIRVTAQSASDDVNVALDVVSDPVCVQPTQAQHVALILSELTTNTLKYAGAGRGEVRIEVRIAQKDDTVTLTFRNDGPDYPQDVLRLARYGAGLDIVQQSVHKSLQGQLSLRNAGGAVTEIRFTAGSRDQQSENQTDGHEDGRGKRDGSS